MHTALSTDYDLAHRIMCMYDLKLLVEIWSTNNNKVKSLIPLIRHLFLH